jgi:hypothetical protein
MDKKDKLVNAATFLGHAPLPAILLPFDKKHVNFELCAAIFPPFCA